MRIVEDLLRHEAPLVSGIQTSLAVPAKKALPIRTALIRSLLACASLSLPNCFRVFCVFRGLFLAF